MEDILLLQFSEVSRVFPSIGSEICRAGFVLTSKSKNDLSVDYKHTFCHLNTKINEKVY